MHNRFVQENNLACEKKYRWHDALSPLTDQSGQARYQKELKDKIQTATDITTVPLTPIPSPHPKTLEQMHEEGRAKQQALQPNGSRQPSSCTDSGCA